MNSKKESKKVTKKALKKHKYISEPLSMDNMQSRSRTRKVRKSYQRMIVRK